MISVPSNDIGRRTRWSHPGDFVLVVNNVHTDVVLFDDQAFANAALTSYMEQGFIPKECSCVQRFVSTRQKRRCGLPRLPEKVWESKEKVTSVLLVIEKRCLTVNCISNCGNQSIL